MLRRLALALVVAGVLVGAASARIVVQKGIAGVRIGMTQAQVRAVLGKPAKTISGRNTFGRYAEYRYRALTLDFQGRTALTSVSTTRRSERTSRGVGVGSTLAQVRTRVPGAHCKVQLCTVGSALPGKIVTTFFLRRGRVSRVNVGRVLD